MMCSTVVIKMNLTSNHLMVISDHTVADHSDGNNSTVLRDVIASLLRRNCFSSALDSLVNRTEFLVGKIISLEFVLRTSL